MRKFVDLSGQVFHRLTVLSPAGKSKNNAYLFTCRCECGKIVTKRASHLIRGEVKSCGCFMIERAIRLGRSMGKHYQCNSDTYGSWSAMKFRCSNQHHVAFFRYGGRGISVCDRWMSFENFLADMGERPPHHSLDRIDNNKGYEPSNCRWATYQEQCRNRSNTRLIAFNGKNLTLRELSEHAGIKQSTIRERMKRGWSIEKSITEAAHAV